MCVSINLYIHPETRAICVAFDPSSEGQTHCVVVITFVCRGSCHTVSQCQVFVERVTPRKCVNGGDVSSAVTFMFPGNTK